MARNSVTSSTETNTNSTTALPWSRCDRSGSGDTVHRVAEDRPELGSSEDPETGHQPCGHHGDEYPAGHITTVVTQVEQSGAGPPRQAEQGPGHVASLSV